MNPPAGLEVTRPDRRNVEGLSQVVIRAMIGDVAGGRLVAVAGIVKGTKAVTLPVEVYALVGRGLDAMMPGKLLLGVAGSSRSHSASEDRHSGEQFGMSE
jgi:hypothetical protein